MKTLNDQIQSIYREAEADLEEVFDGYLKEISPSLEKEEQDRKEGKGIWAGLTGYAAALLWQKVLERHFRGEKWTSCVERMAHTLTNADLRARSASNLALRDIFDKVAVREQNTLKRAFTALKTQTPDFSIYNRDAVRILKRGTQMIPQLKISTPKSDRYYNTRIRKAVKTGIKQGRSIPAISRRLKKVCRVSKKSAILSARTAVTGAENAGRQAVYEAAGAKGIELEKEWVATHDGRTRDSHAAIHGERVPYSGTFSNGCRFPGDPQGPPGEVWNCRCGMRAIIKGVNDK